MSARRKAGVLSRSALVVLALTVVGCGDSGGATTDVLSHAQFVEQANAICQELQEERNEVLKREISRLEPGQQATETQKIEAVRNAILAQYEEMTSGLKSLGAPKKDEEKVDAIVSAMEATVEDVEANPSLAARSGSQFVEANKLNEEFGLTSCMI